MCAPFEDELPYGFRGTRKKVDIRNCTCDEAPPLCACDIFPCACLSERRTHSFSYQYTLAPIRAIDSERALYNHIFPPDRHMCEGKNADTGFVCMGNYRIEFSSLQFVGGLFFMILNKGRTRRSPQITLSPTLRFGDGFSLQLAAVCVHGAQHYYGYGRVRGRSGEGRWLVYDDLIDEGSVRSAPADHPSPWDLDSRTIVRLAVYAPRIQIPISVIDLKKYSAFNHM